MPELLVGGLAPLTSTDYPGCLAAVIFCQGCPWQCGYCQNPHLIPPRADNLLPWHDIAAFLKRRRGLLDAVVFSGGEPTLQSALCDAIRETRDLGFKIGLHTAAPYPERLQTLLPWLDWVGLDIKATDDRYDHVSGVPGSGKRAREGLSLLLDSGVDYEVRTTVHPRFHNVADVIRLAEELRGWGVENFALQEFRPQGCADAALRSSARPVLDGETAGRIAPLFKKFTLRQA